MTRIEFTREQLQKMRKEHEKMAGTEKWYKYLMEKYHKTEKGKWYFLGQNIPTGRESELSYSYKKVKDNEYLIVEEEGGVYRYILTDPVKEFLKNN